MNENDQQTKMIQYRLWSKSHFFFECIGSSVVENKLAIIDICLNLVHLFNCSQDILWIRPKMRKKIIRQNMLESNFDLKLIFYH